MYRHIHIGVGFCVARSTMVGNAKASVRGTSNRYRLPRFFVYVNVNKKYGICVGALSTYFERYESILKALRTLIK